MATNKGTRKHQFYDPASGGGGIVSELLAGEAFDVTSNGAPFAAYPKVKKRIVIDATNNILSTSLGNITIASGTYIYPYADLKTDMETKLNALGATVFTVIVDEKNTKISADALFTIDKLVANSAALTLGYNTLDTSVASLFFRADSVRLFTNAVYLFKLNTDNDSNPPILSSDESTQVAANHRSRSFSGYVIDDTLIGADVDIITSGEIEDWAGLTLGATYHTNGTAGQISTTSVTNSLTAGEAVSTTKLVLDPGDKGFEFQIEPDTDYKANSVDGVFNWKELPELPNIVPNNIAATGIASDGDNVVTAVVESDTDSSLGVSYSTDGGKTFKKATYNGGDIDLTTYRIAGQWNFSEYRYIAPKVLVFGNHVFVTAAVVPAGGVVDLMGLFGTIDANGNLDMRLSNEFESSPRNGTISDNTSPNSRVSYRVFQKNNVIYVTSQSDSTVRIRISKSVDFGATFTSETSIKNVNNDPVPSSAGAGDSQPYRLAVVDVPGQSVTPTELLLNGDFGTGDLTNWASNFASGAGVTQVNADNSITLLNPGPGNTGALDQVVTTVAGRRYRVEYDLIDGGSNQAIQIFDGNTTTTLIDSNIQSPGDARRMVVEFEALSAQSMILIGVKASANATNVSYANFTIQETVKNRVALIAAATSGGVGLSFINLFWTDDQNLLNVWETAIDLGNPLGFAYHLPIGEHLVDNKWYLHFVTGHASANASGGTARTGDTDRSLVTEIDLEAATPTFLQGSFQWDTLSGGDFPLNNYRAATNSNGANYFNDTTNIYKADDGILLSMSLNSGVGYSALVKDISNVASSTQILKHNKYVDHFGNGGTSLVTNFHYGKSAGSLQLVQKRNFGGFGDGETLGAIEALEITTDITAKTNVVTNPDASGTVGVLPTGWSFESQNGTFLVGAGNVFACTGGTGQCVGKQQLALEAGKSYVISANIINDDRLGIGVVFEEDFADIDQGNVSGFENYGLIRNFGTGVKTNSFIAPTNGGVLVVWNINQNIAFNCDDISVTEGEITFGKAVDIIDKPNVDDEGTAGKIQMVSDGSTIHMVAFSDKRVEGTSYSQAVYNNHGFGQEEVAHQWSRFPIEMRDPQAADVSVHDFAISPNGQYRIYVWQQVGGVVDLQVRVSGDFGKTYVPTDITVGSLQAYNSTVDSFQRNSPKCYIDDSGRVCIVFADNVDFTRGYYGTLDANGGIDFDASNGGSAIFGGTAGQGHQLEHNNGILYMVKRRNSGGLIDIALSEDYGANWKSSVGGSTPASTLVKDTSTNLATTGSALVRMWIVDHPTNAGENRVIVHAPATNGDARIAWTDNQDLTANWESTFSVAFDGGGNGEFVIGDAFSDDGSKLALFIRNSNSGSGIKFTYLDVTAGTLAPGTITSMNFTGLTVDDYNGNSAISNSGSLWREISSRVVWTSDQSVVFAVPLQDGNVASEGYLIKIPDIDGTINIGTTVFNKYWDGNAASRTTEQSFVKYGGEYYIIHKAVSSGTGSWANEGNLVVQKMSDPSPTTSTNVSVVTQSGFPNQNDLAKMSLSSNGLAAPFQGKPKVKLSSVGIHVAWVKDSAAGQGLFVNDFVERPVNVEVEEFRRVPTKISIDPGKDVAVHGYSRNGDNILSVGQAAADGSLVTNISTDKGKSWKRRVISNTGSNYNNTTDYFLYNPAVIVRPDNSAVILYFDGATGRFNGIYGEIDPSTNALINTLGSIGSGTGGSVLNGATEAKLAYRGDTVVAASASTPEANIAISTDGGQSFGTISQVKNGGSNAVMSNIGGDPWHVGIVSNGAGGDRIYFICSTVAGQKMWYTDDHGSTWASEIVIVNQGGDDPMWGVATNGDKIALVTVNSDTSTDVYLTICQDLVNGGSAPVWDTEVKIDEGINDLDFHRGYLSTGGSLNNYGESLLASVVWTGTNSLVVAYDVQVGLSYFGGVTATVADTSNILTSLTTVTHWHNEERVTSPTGECQESQLIKSTAGLVYVIFKIVDSSVTTNLTKGRLLARRVYPDGSLGIIQDVGFKDNATTGGFLGRLRVQGDTIIFEKEDSGSIEQLYFNSIELRKIQRGN